MKQLLLTMFITLGLTLGANAQPNKHRDSIQHLSQKKINKMDRKHTRYKAVERNFRTEKQFLHRSRHSDVMRNVLKHSSYQNGYNYDRDRTRYKHRVEPNINRQRGFREPKRGWKLAYKFDRASFYDNRGYYYGYFNHHGYYFEDVFYKYDRHYTYQDRVRGKGLFDHRYYMPSNSRYYGFQ